MGRSALSGRFVSVLVFAVAAIVAPRWLGGNPSHDPRETPRLRWLGRERADRKIGGRSIIVVFGFGLALLGQCLIVLGSGSTNVDLSGSDILLWSILGMVLGLRWRPADLGDEGAQARYLIAVNRAFLVTLVACLAAIVLDSCWGGGRLRHLLEAALLIGCMTLRLSLIIDERRAAAESE